LIRPIKNTTTGAAPPGMRVPPPKLPAVQEILPPNKQQQKQIGGEMDDEISF
jgi:hypothetical protein